MLKHSVIVAAALSLFLLGCKAAPVPPVALTPGTEPALKSISMDEFMNNGLSKSIPLQFDIPASYSHADMRAPITYSYWMPSHKVEQVKTTKNMPTDTGWMYGKITLSVGYDEKAGKFIGVDNLEQQAKMGGFSSVKSEQRDVNGYPVLFLELTSKEEGKTVRSMYVGMKLETNTIYIAYRAPKDSPEEGEYVWSRVKSSLRGL